MEFPKTLYANVLLLDGKIINWQTGKRTWENGKWVSSRQPLDIVIECADKNPDRLQSETFSAVVNNHSEHAHFFNHTSVEFYKMFELSDRYSYGFEPY